MKKYLFFFAVIGWLLGLIVHSLSLAGVDVTERVPFVWILHIGIFVVWIPAVFDLRKNNELKQFQKRGLKSQMNPLAFFNILFKNVPLWLKIVAAAGFFYAFINFLLFASSQPGSTDIKDGQYILHNHGELIKTLTAGEYHHYKANELRGFSGHWLAFYGLAAAMLYPFPKRQ